MSHYEHIPVLLNEAVTALNIHAEGKYIDCTFGRGGHSTEILKALDEEGHLYAFDQDQEAVAHANQTWADKSNFSIVHSSFENLLSESENWGIVKQVDGVLLDLGVSSPQLDDASRGFSFQHDGPLDMRMDNTQGQSAADWLNTAEEEDIANVIYEYGEERNSRRIAKYIVENRVAKPLKTTQDLSDIVIRATRKRDKHKHPATRTFQAIRIFINREVEVLQAVLAQSIDILKPGGRLVVIAFHSLEDRIVKNFIKSQSQAEALPRGLPIQYEEVKMPVKKLGKAIKAGEQELQHNPRARSAVLRIAEVMQ